MFAGLGLGGGSLAALAEVTGAGVDSFLFRLCVEFVVYDKEFSDPVTRPSLVLRVHDVFCVLEVNEFLGGVFPTEDAFEPLL